MNNVTLIGRLTAYPELKATNNGINYTRFTVAVDRPHKSGEEKQADFINCVAWRQTAEFVERYFSKGKMIAVQGSIQTGSFTNKDGAKVYTTDVLVDKVHFCGDKGDTAAAARPNAEFSTGTDYSKYGTPDDDLPF